MQSVELHINYATAQKLFVHILNFLFISFVRWQSQLIIFTDLSAPRYMQRVCVLA